MLNLTEAFRRIQKLEENAKQDRAIFDALAAKFAYYWYDETRHSLAIINRIDGTKADLSIVGGTYISGGFEHLSGIEMVVPDPEWPKANRWQPVIKPREIIDLLESLESEGAEVEDADERKSALAARPQ